MPLIVRCIEQMSGTLQDRVKSFAAVPGNTWGCSTPSRNKVLLRVTPEWCIHEMKLYLGGLRGDKTVQPPLSRGLWGLLKP